METLATKYNQDKPKLSLVPVTFMEWCSVWNNEFMYRLSWMAHSEEKTDYTHNLHEALSALTKKYDISHVLTGMAEVMEFGEQKYSRNNWKKGFVWTEMIDAAMRHAMFIDDIDEETGLHHWKHLSFCLAVLQYMLEFKVGVNDLCWEKTTAS